MYYKEEWINGKLWWKGTPNGEWIPFTIGHYKERVLKLEAELKNLYKANVINRVCENCQWQNNRHTDPCNQCNNNYGLLFEQAVL